MNERFEQLMAGNAIECGANVFVPYHRIHESGENLWSALRETGYMTKAVTEEMSLMPLRIPNRGIQTVCDLEVWNCCSDKVDNALVRDLAGALWAGESHRVEDALNQILEAMLSFSHEYHEYSCHLILDGLFTGLGYRVQPERECGYGRSDLMILDPARRRCLLLELKHVREDFEMEAALGEVQSQVVRKR